MTPEQLAAIPRRTAKEVLAQSSIAIETAMNEEWWRGYRAAQAKAAKIAREGCLVPPDGGSPTDAEREMCEGIAACILTL